MKPNIIYRIMSILLVIIAGFLSLSLLTLIATAFAAPVLLIPAFLLACVVLYSFSSYTLNHKSVNDLTKGRIDFIKVNGFATLVFSLLLGSQSVLLLVKPMLLQDAMEQMKDLNPNLPAETAQLLKQMMLFFAIYSLTLLVHVIQSLALLKANPPQSPEEA